MDNLKSETISGVKWTAIEKFSTQIVNFLLGLLLARLLSPSDFGTIGMLGIFMAISGTFIDSGFSSALIRKPEISDKDYSTAFYFNIVVGLLCYAIMFVCSPLIARFFDMPILNGIVKVYSVTLFINSLTSVQYAKLNRELNFKLQARISFVSALVTGILGVVLAYLGWGVWLLFKRQPICHLAEFKHYIQKVTFPLLAKIQDDEFLVYNVPYPLKFEW